jgi:hypothetical protein
MQSAEAVPLARAIRMLDRRPVYAMQIAALIPHLGTIGRSDGGSANSVTQAPAVPRLPFVNTESRSILTVRAAAMVAVYRRRQAPSRRQSNEHARALSGEERPSKSHRARVPFRRWESAVLGSAHAPHSAFEIFLLAPHKVGTVLEVVDVHWRSYLSGGDVLSEGERVSESDGASK